ncbi:MAG: energy transducer TonB [Saprospiraceae bacterium]|nr:energy transducer TonB [Saprospiraceae bacterium]
MKNILNKLTLVLCLSFVWATSGLSQNNLTDALPFEVHQVYPYISITKAQLNEARSLMDLNADYKSSWIKEYISVEVFANQNGIARKAVSENDILSQEQKTIMQRADVGTRVSVKVKYLPENTLRNNDIKELTFAFTVLPESQAQYSGGQKELIQYLKENAINKIPAGSFTGYDLAAVKFTVSEEGEIMNAFVFESSKDEEIDKLLLETIRAMPCWNPAEYSNGVKVSQEFVLTVGNMENCMVNLLNIRRD